MKEKIFKKGITRRLLSVVLALAMVLTLMPMNVMTVFAADLSGHEEECDMLGYTHYVITNIKGTGGATKFICTAYVFDDGWNSSGETNINKGKFPDNAAVGDGKFYCTQNGGDYYYPCEEFGAPTTYTVRFNANGGDGEMSDVPGQSGSYTLPECAFTAPAGKEFDGWALSAEGEKITTTTIDVTAETTLYALWKNAPHIHGSWDYTASGATLTAECKATTGTCELTNHKVSLILTASSTNYSGNAEDSKATLTNIENWTAANAGEVTVKYFGREGTTYESTTVPTNVGKYTAKAYPASEEANPTHVVTADFEITPKQFEGDGITTYRTYWCFDSTTGTITISGTGRMMGVSGAGGYTNFPWYSIRDKIKNVVIESGVTNVGKNSFNGCINLESVTLPEGITNLDDNAFTGCSSLTSINIPSSTTRIGINTFEKTGLESVTIPSKVTKVISNAFLDCTSLTSVNFAEGTDNLELQGSAFKGCTKLTSIVLPERTSKLSNNVFRYCSSLVSVTFNKATPPEIGIDVLNGCHEDLKIYVPAESVDTYKSKEGNWSTYKDIINAIPHTHNFVYSVSTDGTTLIATCNATGHEGDPVSLTLTASSPNYSGSAATITIGTPAEQTAWTGAELTVPTAIAYEKAGGDTLTAAPTAAGSYVAKVSPVGVTATEANTAKVSFTIEDNSCFKVGENGYQWFSQAVEAANTSKQPIVLLKDKKTATEIPANKNVTIDLNGHYMKCNDSYSTIVIQANSTLKITDTNTNTDVYHYFKYKNNDVWEFVEKPENPESAIAVEAINSNTADDTLIKVAGGVITGNGIANKGTLVVDGVNIVGNNLTNTNGGAIKNMKGEVTINKGMLLGNKALRGGAIVNDAGALTIGTEGGNNENILIAYNNAIDTNPEAEAYGGAIYSYNDGTVTGKQAIVTLNSGEIKYNKCERGAGVCGAVVADTLVSKIIIPSNSTIIISNNKASNGGGGIMLRWGATLEMNAGTITDNSAVKWSGGLDIGDKSKATITGGTIANNSSEQKGGGISVRDNGQLIMSGGSVINNTAGVAGGGVHFDEKDKVEYGVTFSGSAVVKDNTSGADGSKVTDNVYIGATKKITLGTFGNNGSIGVTLGTTDGRGQFIEGTVTNLAQLSNYHSDKGNLMVDLKEQKGMIVDATHAWQYSVNGNQLVAKCKGKAGGCKFDTCGYDKDATAVKLTLSASNANYSGSSGSSTPVTFTKVDGNGTLSSANLGTATKWTYNETVYEVYNGFIPSTTNSSWNDAMGFVDALNSAEYGGHDDWTLLSSEAMAKAWQSEFKDVLPKNSVWSSVEDASNRAYKISCSSGTWGYESKIGAYYGFVVLHSSSGSASGKIVTVGTNEQREAWETIFGEGSIPEVHYVSRTGSPTTLADTTTEPTAKGRYTASISAGDPVATATVNFDIIDKHSHSFTYSANGATLTATCGTSGDLVEACNLSQNKATLTLTASNANYSGTAYTGASLGDTTAWVSAVGGTAPTIEYYQETNKLSGAPTNAGSYTAKATVGTGAGAATATKDFEITKVEQSGVTVSMSGYTYGGTPSTPSTSGTIKESAAATYYYNTTNSNEGGTAWAGVTGTTLEPGTYYMYATLAATTNYNAFTTPAASFTVNSATFAAGEVTAADYNSAYDGAAHGISVTLSGAAQGATVTYCETENGTYTTTAPTVTDVTTTPKTVYYKVSKTGYNPASGSKTITVTPKEVTLSWTGDSFTYNGQEQAPTATAGGLVTGDACTVTVSGGKTNVGASYTATATALSNSNYKLPTTNLTHTFAITAKDITVTITPNGGTYGSTITAAAAVFTGVVTGDTVTPVITYTGNDYTGGTVVPTDAGTYTATVTLSGDKAINYNLTGTTTADFVIAKANLKDLKVVVSSNQFDYDGAEKEVSVNVYFVNEGAEKAEVNSAEYTVEGNKAKDPGTYTITIAAKEGGNLTDSVAVQYSIVKKEDQDNATSKEVGTGSASVSTVTTDGAPATKVEETAAKAFIDAVMDAETKAIVEDNGSMDIVLTVDTASDSIEEAIAIKDAAKATGVYFMDLKLAMAVTDKFGNTKTTVITDTAASPIQITVTIPAEIAKAPSGYTRSYKVLRYHDGDVKVLDSQKVGDTLVFGGDKFSTYAIAYTDTPIPAPGGNDEYIVCEACGHHNWTAYMGGFKCDNCGHLRGTTGVITPAKRSPKTGDDSNMVLYISVMLLSMMGLVGYMAYSRKRSRK